MNKLDAVNVIRKRLKGGGVSVGSWMQLSSSSVAEMMGDAGYDWVAIDLEHGSFSLGDLPDLFRALELGGTLPFVRLASHSAKECKQALDAGAAGVIVPMITGAQCLNEIRDLCRWPPAGKRGVGFSRANLFGKNFLSFSEFAQAPFLVAMIEHVDAVKNIEEILSVRGLDAILIGPYDLSASMGKTGNFLDEKFQQSIKMILEKCNQHSIPAGIHVVSSDIDELKLRLLDGYRFIAYSIDALFLLKNMKNPLL